MAEYTPIFEPFYTDGWENQPSENTPIMGEALDAYDKALESIENFLTVRLPLSVGYSIQAFFTNVGTLRICLLDRFGSILSEKSLEIGSMIISDMSFADGILTLTYKNGTTKEVDITSLLDLITPDITTTDQTTLPNSHSGRIKIEHIGGNMEQKSTTGAQLFDASATPYANSHSYTFSAESGVYEFTATTNYKINRWTIPVKPNTDITVKVNSITPDAIVEISDYIQEGKISNIQSIVSSDVLSTTINSNDYSELTISIYNKQEGTFTVERLMVSYDVDAEYEPYTGGKPSPSSLCPQPIKPVTGKNLLDCRGLEEQTVNGVTFTPVYDENGNLLYIEANGTPTEYIYFVIKNDIDISNSGSCILNGCPSGGSETTYELRAFTEDLSAYHRDFGSGVKVEAQNIYGCEIVIKTTVSKLRFYPMIRPASVVDDTYVPYGLIRIKGHGKNFANISDKTFTINTYFASSQKCFLPKGTYTIHAKCDSVYDIFTDFYVTDANKNKLFRMGNDLLSKFVNENYVTFTIDEDCCYFTWYINNTEGHTFTISDFSIMEGDTGTDYEPYTEQSIILSQPMKLYGNEDVQDVITPRNSERKYYAEVLNGSETWQLVDSDKKAYALRTMPNAIINTNQKCSHYIHSSAYADKTFKIEGNALFIRDTNFATIDDLKTWLAKNTPLVVYELAEPTTETLPTADQIALNSLLSYDGITYVEFDTEIQPTWSAKYGTSEVGGYTLESLLVARNNELKQDMALERITALEATLVNNI